jgi:hypothetical protein
MKQREYISFKFCNTFTHYVGLASTFQNTKILIYENDKFIQVIKMLLGCLLLI